MHALLIIALVILTLYAICTLGLAAWFWYDGTRPAQALCDASRWPVALLFRLLRVQ